MVKVIVDDFQPHSKTWNFKQSMNLDDFEFGTTFTSKYNGGFTRVRFVDEDGKSISLEEAKSIKDNGDVEGVIPYIKKEEEEIVEEEEKELTEEKMDVTPKYKKFF